MAKRKSTKYWSKATAEEIIARIQTNRAPNSEEALKPFKRGKPVKRRSLEPPKPPKPKTKPVQHGYLVKVDTSLKWDIEAHLSTLTPPMTFEQVTKELWRTYLQSNFVLCTSCKRPILDLRTNIIIGKAEILCPKCGHKFKHDFNG